jgi:hypothetical protein
MIFFCKIRGEEGLGEFVLKLRGKLDSGIRGMARELLAAQLAQHFGIRVPQPGIIHLGDSLIEAMPDDEAQLAVKKSIGLNFGCRHLGPGFTTYPKEMALTRDQIQVAADIFAFDALIQNPDRRTSNPNLLIQGNEFVCYDHELAMSFSMIIGKTRQCWENHAPEYLMDHMFRRLIKDKPFDMKNFQARLADLGKMNIDGMIGNVPEDWRTDELDLIRDYLMESSTNCKRIVNYVITEVAR